MRRKVAALVCCCALAWYFMNEIYLLCTLKDVALSPTAPARVVVSMTTFADRIMVTGMYAIHSIIRQDYDLFIISIPLKGRAATLDVSCDEGIGDCMAQRPRTGATEQSIILFLEKKLGNFTQTRPHSYTNTKHAILVQFLSVDYGPATKVLGALLVEKDPETIIVSIDDDIAYNPELIHVLSSYIPQHAALCLLCQALPFFCAASFCADYGQLGL